MPDSKSSSQGRGIDQVFDRLGAQLMDIHKKGLQERNDYNLQQDGYALRDMVSTQHAPRASIKLGGKVFHEFIGPDGYKLTGVPHLDLMQGTLSTNDYQKAADDLRKLPAQIQDAITLLYTQGLTEEERTLGTIDPFSRLAQPHQYNKWKAGFESFGVTMRPELATVLADMKAGSPALACRFFDVNGRAVEEKRLAEILRMMAQNNRQSATLK